MITKKKCINCYQMKICSPDKAVSEFYPRTNGRYQSWCKACNPEVARGYRLTLKLKRASALAAEKLEKERRYKEIEKTYMKEPILC